MIIIIATIECIIIHYFTKYDLNFAASPISEACAGGTVFII